MSTADPGDEQTETDYPTWFRPPAPDPVTPSASSPPAEVESFVPEPDVPAPAPEFAPRAVDVVAPDAVAEPVEIAVPEPVEPAEPVSEPVDVPEPVLEPVDVPEPPVTGDDSVDVVLSELADVMGSSLEDQLAGYEQAHRVLQDRLADVEG